MRAANLHFLSIVAICLLLGGAGIDAARSQDVGGAKKSPAQGVAQKPERAKDDGKKRSEDKQKRPTFSPQREAAALSFVKEHHKELADLLTQLKRQDRSQYERAIGDLFRTSERLISERERDEERWAVSLRLWKVESRIRLMAARLAMDPEDEVLLSTLREALADQMDARLQRLRLDRHRMLERITKLDAAIERAEKVKERSVENSLQKLLQSATRQRAESKQRSANQRGAKQRGKTKQDQ